MAKKKGSKKGKKGSKKSKKSVPKKEEDHIREQEGALENLLSKIDSKFLEGHINRNLLVINAVVTVTLLLLIAYHLSITQYWSAKYGELNENLDKARDDLEHYKQSYQNLQRDIERYDSLYHEQTTMLEYSEEINILEYYYETNRAEYWCIPKVNLDYTSAPVISINASARPAKGWPVIHIFIDGESQQSFEINSEFTKEYSFTADMASASHYIDIIFTTDYFDPGTGQDRIVKLESITVNGQKIEKGSGFYDAGRRYEALDCVSGQSGWTLASNGALRFLLQNPK